VNVVHSIYSYTIFDRIDGSFVPDTFRVGGGCEAWRLP